MADQYVRPVFLKDKFRTGKVEARYPSCNEPDMKYKAEKGGEYTCDILITDEAEMARYQKAYDKAKAEWPNCPNLPEKYKLQLEKGKAKIAPLPWDEDYEEEERGEGTYRVRIRRLAMTKKGVPQKVSIINKAGKPLTGEKAQFGNGSIVVVGFSAKAWFTPQFGFGVTFLPDVVQLHEAKFEGGSAGLAQYGFEVDEEADEDDGDGYGFETEEEGEDSEEDF
jgi:hypothetical protein